MTRIDITHDYLQKAADRFKVDNGCESLDIQAALFDMDGTLYDSMPSHADAWMQMCAENGLKAERDEFFAFEGRTGADTINIIYDRQFGHKADEHDISRLYARKSRLFKERQPVPVMPGAPRLTAECRRHGMQCVIVTGSGQRSLIDKVVCDFPGVFSPELMITSGDVTCGKPSPEPYLKALSLVGCNPGNAIVFENAPLGVKAGVRAGIFTVAITTGPIDARHMWEAGASIVFNSMQECADFFPDLLYVLRQRRI